MPEMKDLLYAAETQIPTLEKARCVLSEACKYFEITKNIPDLPRMSTHILHLLYVVDDILIKTHSELDTAVNNHYAKPL